MTDDFDCLIENCNFYTFQSVLRDEIKSSGKNSTLNQFKIEGGRGSEPRGQFKIAMHQD